MYQILEVNSKMQVATSDSKLQDIIPIPINQPTRCISFSSLLLDIYVQLNVFRASSRPSSGATIVVAASGFTIGAWW
jgi:hypothetical protein